MIDETKLLKQFEEKYKDYRERCRILLPNGTVAVDNKLQTAAVLMGYVISEIKKQPQIGKWNICQKTLLLYSAQRKIQGLFMLAGIMKLRMLEAGGLTFLGSR